MMQAHRRSQLTLFMWSCIALAPIAAHVQQPVAAPSPLPSQAEREAFLLQAPIVAERRNAGQQYAWRATLDDGKRKHDAAIETEDGRTAFQRDYRFNVAAYELDKALDLRVVAPSVVRTVNGRAASVTWWVDDVAMSERDRRAKKIDPPISDDWNKQMQAVRIFDELIANRYRNMPPERSMVTTTENGPPADYAWGELVITRDWRIWLIDHTATFQTRRQLQHVESLTRCDRALLGRLRRLNAEVFKRTLGKYLTPEQLDALEARRALLVKHFDEEIVRKGEEAVLYDLPPRP